ncbi:26978_t:CDS:2, partial [Racocetra persica]
TGHAIDISIWKDVLIRYISSQSSFCCVYHYNRKDIDSHRKEARSMSNAREIFQVGNCYEEGNLFAELII